jgi:hypothetical protein
MGDARLDYSALTFGWFDHFLKGEENDILKNPKVRYFTMGSNSGSQRNPGLLQVPSP